MPGRLAPALLVAVLVLSRCGGDDDPAPDAADDAGGDVPTDVADGDDGGDAADAPDGATPCGSCHGTPESPNPPPDLVGGTERSARGVGAHEVHLGEAGWRAAVRCGHCHAVPEAVDDPGHIDAERPADVTFSGLAAVGVDPTWDGTSCTVYCHGGAMRVAPRTSPAWTSTSGTDCLSCHGLPPADPHPAATDCGRCHLQVADETGAIVRPLMHIDSIVGAPHAAHLPHLGGAGGTDHPCTTCHPAGGVHGTLRDGRTLEETTICDPCHTPGTVDADAWRTYEPFVS